MKAHDLAIAVAVATNFDSAYYFFYFDFFYASSPKTRLKATLGKGLQGRKHRNAEPQWI